MSIELGGDTAGLDAAHKSSADTLRSMASNTQRAASTMANAFSAMSTETIAGATALATGIQRSATSTVSSLRAIGAAASALRTYFLPLLVAYEVYQAFRSLDDSVKATITTFDAAATAAARLGVSVEQLSRMGFAARVAGLSTEQFSGALDTLIANSQKTDDVFAASTRALSAMGLELKDLSGNAAGSERALLQIANRFQNMEDGVRKSALAVALFGENGNAMLPFLNRGAAGIAELIAQSDRFGATISTDLADQSKQYTENMRKLGELNSLIAKNVSQELIPSFNSWSGTLLTIAERFELASRAGTLFRGVLAVMDQVLAAAAVPFKALIALIGGALGAAIELMKGNFTGARDHLVGIAGDIGTALAKFSERTVDNVEYVFPSLRELGNEMGNVVKNANWAATVEKQKAPVMETAEAIRKAMADAAEQNRVMFQELTRDTAIPLNDKLILLRMHLDAGGISLRLYSTAVAQAYEQQSQFNHALGQMTLSDLLANKNLPMTDKVAQLNQMVRDGTISWRDYLGAMKDVNQQGQQAMDDLLSATSSALSSIFGQNKTAAIASTLINTYQAISKALAQYGPTPQGFALSAIAGAVGFAQVMKIRQTSHTGSSGGGGSASSGAGSAAASAASAQTAPPPQESTLFVKGISPRDMYTGEVVRELAKKFIDFQKDGGRLVLE
ncbi:MAG: hypothetical protein ACR2K1_08895 [Saprospiraceae bacterium]